MSGSLKVKGFEGFDAALAELTPATGKGVLRRVGRKVLQPIADDYIRHAPRDTGELSEGAGVSSKLSKRQAKIHRKMFKDDRAAVELFVGPGAVPQAHLSEFGSINQAAQPAMRPAWENNKDKLLPQLAEGLWVELEKSVKRSRAKAAKSGKG